MAEEKERLQGNLLSKIRTEISVEKYLSQLYFEGSNRERERERACVAQHSDATFLSKEGS